MKVTIIATERAYNLVKQVLLPPCDPNEHFGFGVAGVSRIAGTCNLLLRKFILADSSCLANQSGASIRPDPRFVRYVWAVAKKSNSVLIDFHTHPFCDMGVTFSSIDDNSELDSFPKAVEYLGEGPHASVVLGKDSLDARWFNPTTHSLVPVTAVKILGESLTTIITTSGLQTRSSD
jgi:hypothetical protein